MERFNDAFNRHDVDGVMALMSPDCEFESMAPPDGERHVGQTAVRRYWEELFGGTPDARFDTEEVVVAGDRAVVTWTYRWYEDADGDGHVRGVDLFTIRDGLVAAKRSYVKG